MAAQVVSMAVRLLDISAEGLLLGCPRPIRPGSTSRVVAKLGPGRLDAVFEVRHSSKRFEQQHGGYRVGGRFVSLDPEEKLAIQDLLRGTRE